MAFSDAAKNLMLEALVDVGVFVSLHTGDPGSNGANEVTGGSPAYARKAITWDAASSAVIANDGEPVFDVPAATTVTHYGIWSAATDGTFYVGVELEDSEAFTGQGTFTLTEAELSLTEPA